MQKFKSLSASQSEHSRVISNWKRNMNTAWHPEMPVTIPQPCLYPGPPLSKERPVSNSCHQALVLAGLLQKQDHGHVQFGPWLLVLNAVLVRFTHAVSCKSQSTCLTTAHSVPWSHSTCSSAGAHLVPAYPQLSWIVMPGTSLYTNLLVHNCQTSLLDHMVCTQLQRILPVFQSDCTNLHSQWRVPCDLRIFPRFSWVSVFII